MWQEYYLAASVEDALQALEGWRGKAIDESSVYYKVIRTSDDGMIKYELYRFTEVYQYDYKGKVLEIVSSTEDFPAEMDPNSSTYSILYIRDIGPIGEVFVYIILLLVCIGAAGAL